jgi:hypothetical protein
MLACIASHSNATPRRWRTVEARACAMYDAFGHHVPGALSPSCDALEILRVTSAYDDMSLTVSVLTCSFLVVQLETSMHE